jgi:hypothetical protein
MPRTVQTKQQTDAARAIADGAARTLIDHVITWSDMLEHSGAAWSDLSEQLQKTSHAHLTDRAAAIEEADKEAAFLIGVEVGRRLAGGGR